MRTSSDPVVLRALPARGAGRADRCPCLRLGDGRLDPRTGQSQFFAAHGQGDHDLHDRVPTGGHPVQGGFHQGPHLHGVEAGLDHTEADAAGAEHRVDLVPRSGCLVQPALFVREADGGLLDGQLLDVGEELVERGVEQPDGDRQIVHGLEDVLEIGPLDDPQSLECLLLLCRGGSQDHPAHDGKTVLGQEHVLGPAQADSLGSMAAGVGRVRTVVGVGPNTEVPGPDVVGHSSTVSNSGGV